MAARTARRTLIVESNLTEQQLRVLRYEVAMLVLKQDPDSIVTLVDTRPKKTPRNSPRYN